MSVLINENSLLNSKCTAPMMGALTTGVTIQEFSSRKGLTCSCVRAGRKGGGRHGRAGQSTAAGAEVTDPTPSTGP